MCLLHLSDIGMHSTFKLNHKVLSLFGINRRCLKTYLSLFQQAGLLSFSIKKGTAPIITLDKNIINKIKNTRWVSKNVQGQVQYCSDNLDDNAHDKKELQGKQGIHLTQEVREVIQQGIQDNKGMGKVDQIRYNMVRKELKRRWNI